MTGVQTCALPILAWAWLWLKGKLQPEASLFPPGLRQLEAAPTVPIAIFVPLWHEDAVIARMLEHNLGAIRYPEFHIFAGCYPNDAATQAAVRSVSDRFPNVHLAICPHDGPTSKADCLNWVYQNMLVFEEQNGTRFEVIVTHDAEDLVHPEELRWLNYYGLESGSVPPYTQWGSQAEIFVKAFQGSWSVLAGFGAVAVVTSAMRGVDRRQASP